MTVTCISSASSTPQLVKLANGEYSAASVTADPKDATKLNLVKEQDGNYGTTPPAPVEAKSSPDTLATLLTLSLGGS